MNPILIKMLVTTVWFAIAVVIGWRLKRSAKPYPPGWLIAHIILFLWIVGGVLTCLYLASAAKGAGIFSMLSLYLATLTLFSSLLTGVAMIIKKQKSPGWIFAHKLSMLIMGAAIILSMVFIFPGI